MLYILPVAAAVFSHGGHVPRLCQDLSGYRFTAVTGSWGLQAVLSGAASSVGAA